MLRDERFARVRLMIFFHSCTDSRSKVAGMGSCKALSESWLFR